MREPATAHGEYRVTGTRPYRGHDPGTIFEALLERRAEARAIARGDIELVRRITPTIQEGSYTFPVGWLPDNEQVNKGRPVPRAHQGG